MGSARPVEHGGHLEADGVEGPAVEPVPQRVEQDRSRAGQATADHHAVGVEDQQQGGQSAGEPVGGLVDDLEGHLVPFSCGREERGQSVHLLSGVYYTCPPVRRYAGTPRRRAGEPADGLCADDSFEGARSFDAEGGRPGHDVHEAQFAGGRVALPR